MTQTEMRLRYWLAVRLVRLAGLVADVAVWLAPWALGGMR